MHQTRATAARPSRTASTMCMRLLSLACFALPILCYFRPTDCNLAVVGPEWEWEMIRPTKASKRNLFLAADGVATRLAVRELKTAKIDPGPLLAKAGIAPLELGEEPKRVGAESQIRFLEITAEALGDPVLGLHLAQHFDLRECGMLYYVLAASPDIGEAIHNLVRYLAVSNESIRLGVYEKTESTVLAVNYKIPRHTDRQFAEYGYALVLRACRELTGRNISPKAVTFIHRRNTHKAEFERFYGCTVRFNATVDTMVLPTEVLSTPILTSDKYLLRILKDACEEVLAKRDKISSTLRAMVENEIVQLLPHGKAQVEKVANNLGMSNRTLARRLSEEGTSYAAILNELRRDLSARYLKDPTLSLNQIAWLLGYSMVSSLNHAFRRWTGSSPKAIGKRIASAGLANA
jgi:AraC-like DNA-binding protein